MLVNVIKAALTLFIIIDPFLSMSMFLTITSGQDKAHIRKQASTAVYVAGIMLFFFLVAGNFLLNIFKISFQSFKIGGGIILLLLGIRTILGAGFGDPYKYKPSIIIIGTPMLSGPGAMTTVIVLSQTFGALITAIACIIVLLVSWVILEYSYYIQKFLGYKVVEVLSRIMGLFLIAIAVQYVTEGIIGVIGN